MPLSGKSALCLHRCFQTVFPFSFSLTFLHRVEKGQSVFPL